MAQWMMAQWMREGVSLGVSENGESGSRGHFSPVSPFEGRTLKWTMVQESLVLLLLLLRHNGLRETKGWTTTSASTPT